VSRWGTRWVALAGVVVVLWALPAAARAADFRGGDDRLVISGDVNVARGEHVDTVAVLDGDITIAGDVEDDVIAGTGKVRVTGTGHIGGDLVTLTDQAQVLPGGRVDGDAIYVDEKPAVAPGAHVGEVRHLEASEIGFPLSIFIASLLIWLAVSVSTLALGLLLLWLVPRAMEAAFVEARRDFGPAIAAGLAGVIGLPIVAVLALATLVGIPFGALLLLALLPLFAIGYTTSAYLLGRTLVGPPRGRIPAFLAGWGILRAVALIPFLGLVAWLAATVFGLGALAVAAWRARDASPAAAPPTPAP
jgi:hypothetical protein